MRTEDLNYEEDYWNTLDGGAGYCDSTLWEDLAYIIKETFAISRSEIWEDKSSSVNTVDVGCAYGFLVRHLRRRGIDAWGLDYSEYALGQSPEDTKQYLRQFDLTHPNPSFYGEEKFKLLTCLETLEHIPEEHVDWSLHQLKRLLVPGGRALLTICTINQPGWDSDPTHVTIKSHEWWNSRLDTAGFVQSNEDYWAEDYLKQHWLFSQHDGVFVVTKPELEK